MVIQKRDLYRSDKSNYDILADRSEGATKKRATRGDTEDSVCLYTFLPVPGPKRTKLKSGSPATWTLTGRETARERQILTCFFNTKFWFWASVFKMFCHSFDTRDVCLSCSHFMHLYLILSLRTLLVKALFYISGCTYQLVTCQCILSVFNQKSACLSSHFSSVSGGGKQFGMPQISFHLFFHSYHFPLSAVTISTRRWVHC